MLVKFRIHVLDAAMNLEDRAAELVLGEGSLQRHTLFHLRVRVDAILFRILLAIESLSAVHNLFLVVQKAVIAAAPTQYTLPQTARIDRAIEQRGLDVLL